MNDKMTPFGPLGTFKTMIHKFSNFSLNFLLRVVLVQKQEKGIITIIYMRSWVGKLLVVYKLQV